ncbi:MAG: cytochrome c biogenesis heme-transporting ATPase CcmA [Gammaproteobacteria bacterium]|nr:MAG: cytochrome c biogenesis heme-transporting ATPase CcmA [Gammaproteobacteria bacterium]
MLEVRDLCCIRGERLLFADVNFSLSTGALLYIEGPNGSGKTTLQRTLCGLFTPEKGGIWWKGEEIDALDEEYTRDVLYLGHLNGIKGELTALENLRFAAVLDGDEISDHALNNALDRLGLSGYEDLPTKVLSQGQKRRVALARLLLSNARMWVLDEPFTALDVAAVDLLQTMIADHISDGGMVVLTTHQEVALTSGQIQRLKLSHPKTC